MRISLFAPKKKKKQKKYIGLTNLLGVNLWEAWILAQLVEVLSVDGALSQKAKGLLVQSGPIPIGCPLAHL
jgi:hypothetical protein